MIRMSRLTDYGIMLLTWMAREPGRPMHNARELAADAHLPLPTVRKILKHLAHHGILEAHRGVKGGFSLARRPQEVSVADVLGALEGPLGLTDCTAHSGDCRLEPVCIVRSNWKKINRVVLDALRRVSLAEMAQPLPAAAPRAGLGVPRLF
jgi:FeS assembly SUF system regulator